MAENAVRWSPATGKLPRLRIDAQTLIVLGVGAAYLLSVVHTLRGEGSLYFDTAAMVLVIVTLGSYLEAGANQRPSKVVYDRAGSSICDAAPGDFDWASIFDGASDGKMIEDEVVKKEELF